MHVNRYTPAQNRRLPCGCFAIIGVLGIVAIISVGFLITNLPSMALQLAGFQPLGNTDDVMSEADANTGGSFAPIVLQEAQPASNIQINVPNSNNINLAIQSYVDVGQDAQGISVALAQFNEADLQRLCLEYTPYCGSQGDVVRSANVDLRANGAIVRGEVRLPNTNVWQNLGIVVDVVQENRIRVRGVDVDDTLYAIPDNEIGQWIREGELRINQWLQEGNISIAGNTYRLSSVQSDGQQLVIVLR
jgi:hypothetical protein